MLAQQHCEACTPQTPRVGEEEAKRLAKEVPSWYLGDDRISREWRLRDFAQALALINAIGRVAEAEKHHPDIHLTGYRHVLVELQTHAIHGLSRNDFILAARIDQLPEAQAGAESGAGKGRPARPAA